MPARLPLPHLCLALGASLLSAVAIAAPPSASTRPKTLPAAAEPASALLFVKEMYAHLDRLTRSSQKRPALHAAIRQEMNRHMDYPYMGERILGSDTWKGLKKGRRAEFLSLLEGMVQRTYVKHFRAGHKVVVRYDGPPRSRKGRVQVRTTLTVKRTTAEVWYSMRHVAPAGWRVYDIVIDEASQLATYRRSFRRVLKKEGWQALIARMKKSASRS